MKPAETCLGARQAEVNTSRMVDRDIKEDLSLYRKRLPAVGIHNGAVAPLWNSRDADIDILRYWMLLRSWRRVIAFATAAAVLVTFVVAKYVLAKQYRATVIIKAVSHKSGLAAAAGALLGGDMGIGGILGQGLSGASEQTQEYDPEELMAMMRSYAFTIALINKYKLGPHLLAETPLGNFDRRSREWRLYKIMKRSFTCDFDYKTTLINAYFVDQDPTFAEQVLGDYVETLRNQLRDQAVSSTTVAIQSLEEEADRSSDMLLRDKLYQLITGQIEDQKRAQMDANYAFRVIEPPITSPEKYYPSVRGYCLLALFITPVAMIVLIFAHAFYLRFSQMLRLLEESMRDQWIKDGQPQSTSDSVASSDWVQTEREPFKAAESKHGVKF
jgi:hypothetical protein